MSNEDYYPTKGNPLKPIIDGLDERKKAAKKSRLSPTPGLMATELMLAHAKVAKSNPEHAKGRLAELRAMLEKDPDRAWREALMEKDPEKA